LDKDDFGIDFHLKEAVVRTVQEYLLIGNSDLVPQSPFANHFLELLRFLGTTALLLGIYSIFKPIYGWKKIANDQRRALLLTDQWEIRRLISLNYGRLKIFSSAKTAKVF